MSPSTSPYKVVCFDLDGTLLRGTSVSRLLAQRLGRTALMEELEERFRRHEISNTVAADVSACWHTGLTRAEVWECLRSGPWLKGIRPTLQRLKERDLKVLLGTITWRFAADLLQERYGFDAVCGTEMEECDGRLAGRVLRYCDEHDKLAFVEASCRAHGCSLRECVAVGDSRSDLPLFRRVGLAIALNATPEAREAAHVCLDTDDLTTVLPVIFARSTRPVRSSTALR